MLRHITIPLLRPAIFFVVTMGLISCFQVFDQIYVMTAGGPLDSTLTIAYLVYKAAFRSTTPRVGYASAVAFVLAGSLLNSLPIILLFFLFQRYFTRGIALTGLKGV